ncbi:hypothetical protein EVAR_4700_1 [Eumeta japonica]|uniref:Uncharacterized protein n=1 Tax=Eumeta variegata TaxID=151549 RepID=A0A4C1WQP3_EUMVA|nr:hypothetical protein EVAR_4700_1 [Eumeta japonica]
MSRLDWWWITTLSQNMDMTDVADFCVTFRSVSERFSVAATFSRHGESAGRPSLATAHAPAGTRSRPRTGMSSRWRTRPDRCFQTARLIAVAPIFEYVDKKFTKRSQYCAITLLGHSAEPPRFRGEKPCRVNMPPEMCY